MSPSWCDIGYTKDLSNTFSQYSYSKHEKLEFLNIDKKPTPTITSTPIKSVGGK